MIDKATSLQRKADDLAEYTITARDLARKLGLDGPPVTYWLVSYAEMNELIAYDGFQARYPHWRWGMKYERQSKQDRFVGGKAFEIVINTDPAHAFLQESNADTDQKAVMTHVEAHADFFANNRWYQLFGEIDAPTLLEGHARRIEQYMEDADIGRGTVERWIDNVLPLVDTIDQHRPYEVLPPIDGPADPAAEEHRTSIAELGFSPDIASAVFDDEWIAVRPAGEDPGEPARDVLAYVRQHGHQYEEDTGKAVAMTDWQKDIIDILRAEAYYFAPQRMTRVMNEGWASYWESIMMTGEAFAGTGEVVDYADHHSKILGSPGLNPYTLGKALWEYIENTANRREVVECLLRTDGITWRNFHDMVDFDRVHELLAPEPPLSSITPETLPDLQNVDPGKIDLEALDHALSGELDITTQPWRVLTYQGLAERHFSLLRPQNRQFLARIDRTGLERISRYLFDDAVYDSVTDAVDAVEYTAGWDKIFEVRESHNDVTFLDEFLTPGFIKDNQFFTFEYSHAAGDFRVASTEPDDVKKKLLLQFTNFGKPTITVEDGNYNNRNELLLAHQYNGIPLDVEQAGETLKRVFNLWGRPVNLKTIVKELSERDREVARRRGREPSPVETGTLLRYDGDQLDSQDLDWEEVAHIAATDIDYSTKPEDWLN